MFKSMSIHKNDNKETIKFEFVTSCLTFTDLISILITIEAIKILNLKEKVSYLRFGCSHIDFH